MMERTFDHTHKFQTLEQANHLTMTDGQLVKREIHDKYVPKYKQHHTLEVAHSKRGSTNQLVEVSPGSCSPEVMTDKSGSFVSNSTILHSPDMNLMTEQKENMSKNSNMKKMQTRRESRVLIQTLPRLQTQSKYNSFRLAKSSERREYSSVRNKLRPSSQISSPLNVTQERFSKATIVKTKNKHSISSDIKSPRTTCAKTEKNTKEDGFNRDTSDRRSYKYDRRVSNASDSATKPTKGCSKAKSKSSSSQILYPSVNHKTTMEVMNDCGKQGQLNTLLHHLNTISDRREKLQSEIILIDKKLDKNRKMQRMHKSSRNSTTLMFKGTKSNVSPMKNAEAVMNKKRKSELQKEVETLAVSIRNVKERIDNFSGL